MRSIVTYEMRPIGSIAGSTWHELSISKPIILLGFFFREKFAEKWLHENSATKCKNQYGTDQSKVIISPWKFDSWKSISKFSFRSCLVTLRLRDPIKTHYTTSRGTITTLIALRHFSTWGSRLRQVTLRHLNPIFGTPPRHSVIGTNGSGTTFGAVLPVLNQWSWSSVIRWPVIILVSSVSVALEWIDSVYLWPFIKT